MKAVFQMFEEFYSDSEDNSGLEFPETEFCDAVGHSNQ
jgi:hypothetical protein